MELNIKSVPWSSVMTIKPKVRQGSMGQLWPLQETEAGVLCLRASSANLSGIAYFLREPLYNLGNPQGGPHLQVKALLEA